MENKILTVLFLLLMFTGTLFSMNEPLPEAMCDLEYDLSSLNVKIEIYNLFDSYDLNKDSLCDLYNNVVKVLICQDSGGFLDKSFRIDLVEYIKFLSKEKFRTTLLYDQKMLKKSLSEILKQAADTNRNCSEQIAKLILIGLDPNSVVKYSYEEKNYAASLLSYIIRFNMNTELIPLLLIFGADPDSDLCGYSALMSTPWTSDKAHEIATILMTFGANVNARNPHEMTVFAHLVPYLDDDMMNRLLRFGFRMESLDAGELVFIFKYYWKSEAALKLLLKNGVLIYNQDKRGWVPLHVAIVDGRVNTVKMLLNHHVQEDRHNFREQGYRIALYYSRIDPENRAAAEIVSLFEARNHEQSSENN